MIARNLIADIPPLTPDDTVQRALEWMDDFHVRHLPVVETGDLLGLLNEEACLDQPQEAPLHALGSDLLKPFLRENQHLFDAIRLIAEQDLSAVPVLNQNGKYIGMVTMESLLKHFAESGSVAHPGAVIILEMHHRDYALSEIARLVEMENAKILSSNISSQYGTTELEVTLKLNTEDIRHVVATLERFGYNVKAAFHESAYMDPLKERYESLLNYLRV